MFQLMIIVILREDVDTLKNIVINSIWLFSIKYWYYSHIILQCAVLPNIVDDSMLQHFNAYLYQRSPWGWLLTLAEICHRVTDVYVNHKMVQLFGNRYIFAKVVISCYSLTCVLNWVQKFHRVVHKLFASLSFYVTCVREGMNTSGKDGSLLCHPPYLHCTPPHHEYC